jgi:hypothetical protein
MKKSNGNLKYGIIGLLFIIFLVFIANHIWNQGVDEEEHWRTWNPDAGRINEEDDLVLLINIGLVVY